MNENVERSTQAPAASAEPVELVEAVTKAIMFEDCGNTTDWRDNTDLGKAAIRAYAAAVRAAIAPHRAEQVALMQEADKDGRVFNGQGHAQAIQAIDFCLASLAAPVAAQAQSWAPAGSLRVECDPERFGEVPWHVTDGHRHAVGTTPNEALNGFARYLAAQAPAAVGDALTDLVHSMFRSGNGIPVERITITRAQYDAAMQRTTALEEAP